MDNVVLFVVLPGFLSGCIKGEVQPMHLQPLLVEFMKRDMRRACKILIVEICKGQAVVKKPAEFGLIRMPGEG